MDRSCFSFSHTASSPLVTNLTPTSLRDSWWIRGEGRGRNFSRKPDFSRAFSPLLLFRKSQRLSFLLLCFDSNIKLCLSVPRLWTTSPSSCTSWPWRHSCCVWGSREWRSTRARKPRRPWRSSRLRRRGGWPSRPRSSSTTWRKTEQRREAAVHRYCAAPPHKTCGKYFKKSTYLVLWNYLISSRKMSCIGMNRLKTHQRSKVSKMNASFTSS